jgi:hypothetical protein
MRGEATSVVGSSATAFSSACVRSNSRRAGDAVIEDGGSDLLHRQLLQLFHRTVEVRRLRNAHANVGEAGTAQQCRKSRPEVEVAAGSAHGLFEPPHPLVVRGALGLREASAEVRVFDDDDATRPHRRGHPFDHSRRVVQMLEQHPRVRDVEIRVRELLDRCHPERHVAKPEHRGFVARDVEQLFVEVDAEHGSGRAGAAREFYRHVAAATAEVDAPRTLWNADQLEQDHGRGGVRAREQVHPRANCTPSLNRVFGHNDLRARGDRYRLPASDG